MTSRKSDHSRKWRKIPFARQQVFLDRGEPPKRIVLFAFENIDKAQAAFASPGYAEAYTHGEKYAKFRIYAVEGVPQQ